MSLESNREEALALEVRSRAYVVGAIAVLIVTVITCFIAIFTDAGQLWTWPIDDLWMQMYMRWPLFMFMWPYFIALAAALFRKGNFLNKWELTVVISMVWVTWLIPSWFGVIGLFAGPAGGIALGDERWLAALSPVNAIYGPDFGNSALWNGLYRGGAAVPWSGWVGFIVFNTVWVITSMYGFMGLVANLLRRQWIEVEALSFPNVVPVVQMINSTYSGEGRSDLLTNKWLYLGMIIAALELSPLWLPGLNPFVFPVTVANVLGPDLSPLTVTPYLIPMVFNFELHWIGMGLFIPVRLLLSFVLCWFIAYWILPVVWTTAGLWDANPGGYIWHYWVWTPGGWGSWGPISDRWVEDFGGMYGMPGIGIMFAVLLIPLFRLRREILPIISSIWKQPSKEFEKNEPIPLRLTWGLLAVMFVIWLALTAWAGGPVLANAIVPFTIFYGFLCLILIGGISTARVYGDFGRAVNFYNDGMCIWTNHVWGHWYLTETYSPWYGKDNLVAYSRAMVFGPWEEPYGYSSNAHLGPSMGIYSLLESYKMADSVGLHPKHIFKGYWIAIPISVIATFVLTIQFGYTFGLQAKAAGFNLLGWPAVGPASWPIDTTYLGPTNAYAIPQAYKGPTIGSTISVVIGFAVGAILYYLSTTYPRWPIQPLSLAVVLAYTDPHWFTPLLVALLVKYLVIRIGGTRLFAEKVQPFAVGTVVVSGILFLITGLATAYRAITGIA